MRGMCGLEILGQLNQKKRISKCNRKMDSKIGLNIKVIKILFSNTYSRLML